METIKKNRANIQIAALESEGTIKNVSKKDLKVRRELIKEMLGLPAEAFTKLRFIIPQTGCFNRCAFCSQSAVLSIWQLNSAGLANL